jgi:serine/threonine protein kinase
MSDDVIAGRYELLELVGRGGMSSVWKAHDRLLDRTVAIKVLHEHYTQDEEYVERFRREARSVAQVSHPNIVTVIDRGEDGGRQYIVFEYVDGENLKQVIEREGPLPVRDALLLALQVARALGFAHDRGLVHRDVKPQNVLLNDDGQAKVTDFGIARSVDVDGVTVTGTVLGTSEYIAPEQARGQRVDAHTDVYSLGVVLYELLTGAVPFSGESFVTVALQHVNEAPPDVLEHRPDCPPRVALAIERAMAKEPEDRPMMDELVTELEACLADLDPMSEQATMIAPPRATPRTTQPPRRRRRRRVGLLWPIVAVLLVLAVAALAALGAMALRDNDNGSPAAASNPIHLTGVASYDPEGDNKVEHPEAVPRATDGDPNTYWTTEDYDSFTKSGVGLVLDAGREVEPSSIVITTDTPGYQAEIRAGPSPQGPFDQVVSDSKTVDTTTTFELKDAKSRYFVVWITRLDGIAHVNEVRAS